MSMLRLFLSALALTLCASPTLAAAPSLQPGNWQASIQVQMPGLPEMPPISTTYCLTPEQAADPEKSLMDKIKQGQSEGKEQCKTLSHSLSGQTARWSVQCTGTQKVKSNFEITYEGSTAYHGTIISEIETPDGAMTMNQSIDARRLGDCKK